MMVLIHLLSRCSCKQSVVKTQLFILSSADPASHSSIPQNPPTGLLCPVFLSCDLPPLWISKVWLILSVFLCLPSPLSSNPHAASSPSTPPSHRLPFCHACWWWEALFHRVFTPRRPLPGFLADVDKRWCCGCQAIQITQPYTGIKRSIASFSKSKSLPRPLFMPGFIFHRQNES